MASLGHHSNSEFLGGEYQCEGFLMAKEEGFYATPLPLFGIVQVTQTVKNPPAMQKAWVQSLDWEDPLEKEMAVHSSVLAGRILWTEEPGRLQSMGSQSQTRLSD